jgi:hypothetical protein
VDVREPQKSRGLTAAQAAERLAIYGRNALSPPKTRSAIVLFLLKARRRGAHEATWRAALHAERPKARHGAC